jgi:hypothetical protein
LVKNSTDLMALILDGRITRTILYNMLNKWKLSRYMKL